MNPKNLLSFIKVVECGTMNRAAAQLHITQPALSRRISALEEELKLSLFDRRGPGVTLTEAGTVLREHADGLLRHIEQVRFELLSRSSTPGGNLSVGLPSPFRSVISRALIPSFCMAYREVKLHVFENSPNLIRDMLLSGTLEFGVISSEDAQAGLACEPLLAEQLFLAGAPDRGLSPDNPIPAAVLSGIPLVQAVRTSAIRTILARHFAQENAAIVYNVEVEGIHLMIDVAASGHSYTVLPYSAIREPLKAGVISAAPLADLSIEWFTAHPLDRKISLASKCFAKELRRVAQAEVESGEWLGARLPAAD